MRILIPCAFFALAACGDDEVFFELDSSSVELQVDTADLDALATFRARGQFSVEGAGGELRVEGNLETLPTRESSTILRLAIVSPDPAVIADDGAVEVEIANVATTNATLVPLCELDLELILTLSRIDEDSGLGEIVGQPLRLQCSS